MYTYIKTSHSTLVNNVSRLVMSNSVITRAAACQVPLFMGFSRQGYWSGLSFPSPGDLSDPGIKPESPSLQAYSLLSEPPGESQKFVLCYLSNLCPQNSPSKNTRVGSCSLSRGSSQPKDRTQVSCLAGRFFTVRATREACAL